MAKQSLSVDHRKPCTLCNKPRDVLVRCQIDSTGKWHFVCPGTCWKSVSGGVIDGDKSENHEFYRYGGMWKNKHEAVSAKKPKAKTKASNVTPEKDSNEADDPLSSSEPGGVQTWTGSQKKYVTNDKVEWEGQLWICRKLHFSDEKKTPNTTYSLWKDVPQGS